MDPLTKFELDFIQEYMKGGDYLSPSTRNLGANYVAGIFRSFAEDAGYTPKDFTNIMTLRERVGERTLLMKKVFSTPISDFGNPFEGITLGKGGRSPSATQLGEQRKSLNVLKAAQTVGDIANIVIGSYRPAVGQQMLSVLAGGRDPAAIIGQVHLSLMEKMGLYDPSRHGGKSFDAMALRAIRAGATGLEREEIRPGMDPGMYNPKEMSPGKGITATLTSPGEYTLQRRTRPITGRESIDLHDETTAWRSSTNLTRTEERAYYTTLDPSDIDRREEIGVPGTTKQKVSTDRIRQLFDEQVSYARGETQKHASAQYMDVGKYGRHPTAGTYYAGALTLPKPATPFTPKTLEADTGQGFQPQFEEGPEKITAKRFRELASARVPEVTITSKRFALGLPGEPLKPVATGTRTDVSQAFPGGKDPLSRTLLSKTRIVPTGRTYEEEPIYTERKPFTSLTTGKRTGESYYQLNRWTEEQVTPDKEYIEGTWDDDWGPKPAEGKFEKGDWRAPKFEEEPLDEPEERAAKIIKEAIRPTDRVSGARQPLVDGIRRTNISGSGEPGDYLGPYTRERQDPAPDPRKRAYEEYIASLNDADKAEDFDRFSKRPEIIKMGKDWLQMKETSEAVGYDHYLGKQVEQQYKENEALRQYKGEVSALYTKEGYFVKAGPKDEIMESIKKDPSLSAKTLRTLEARTEPVKYTGGRLDQPPEVPPLGYESTQKSRGSGTVTPQGEIYQGAYRFLSTLPGGKDIKMQPDFKLQSTAAARGGNEIVLGKHFFDDAYMQSKAVQEFTGDVSVKTARNMVVAHEYGHIMANDKLQVASQEYLNMMKETSPESHGKLMDHYLGVRSSYGKPGAIARELSAEIMASIFDKESRLLTEKYLIGDEEKTRLQEVGLEALQEKGITSEAISGIRKGMKYGFVDYLPTSEDKITHEQMLKLKALKFESTEVVDFTKSKAQTIIDIESGNKEAIGSYLNTTADEASISSLPERTRNVLNKHIEEQSRSSALRGKLSSEDIQPQGSYYQPSAEDEAALRKMDTEQRQEKVLRRQAGYKSNLDKARAGAGVTTGEDYPPDMDVTEIDEAEAMRKPSSAWATSKMKGIERGAQVEGTPYKIQKMAQKGDSQTPAYDDYESKGYVKNIDKEGKISWAAPEAKPVQDYQSMWENVADERSISDTSEMTGRQKFLAKLQNIPETYQGQEVLKSALKWETSRLGVLQPITGTEKEEGGPIHQMIDPKKGIHTGEAVWDSTMGRHKATGSGVPGSPTVSATWEQVAGGKQLADQAFSYATSDLPSGMDAKDLASTIEKRMGDYVSGYVNEVTGRAEQEGGPERARQAKAHAGKVHDIAKAVTREYAGAVASNLGLPTKGAESYKDVAYGRVEAMRGSASQIGGAAMADPKLAAWLGAQYGGPEQAARAKPWVYSTEGAEGRVTYSGGEAGGGFYGGGGGGGGGRRGERKTLWTSSFGKALYGAYIAKRMWSWTAQPMIQKATEYGQYMSSMAPMAGDDVISSDTGYATRQQLAKEYMSEGAYEQFGGFSDWIYSMSGGGGKVPRIAAGAGLAAGVATAGMVAGTTASIFGGSTAAASLTGAAAVGAGAMGTAMTIGGAIGVGAGVAMGAGLIGMEVYNEFLKPSGDKDATYGNVWSKTTSNIIRGQAERAYYKDAGIRQEIGMGGGALPEVSIEKLEAGGYLTHQQATYFEVARKPIEPEIEELKDITESIARKMGAKSEEVQPGIRQITNITGKVSPTQIEGFADTAQALQMTFPEIMTAFTSVYSALGIQAGSPEASRLAEQIIGVKDQGELQDITAKASQQARYSGMLSSYYQDPFGAQAFVAEAGITTMARAQPIQQMMAAASQYGLDPETVVGRRRAEGDPQFGFADITFDQALGEMEERIGPKRTALAGAVAPKMMARGMAPGMATAWVEGTGMETGMQWAAADVMMSGVEQFGPLNTAQMGLLSIAGQQTNMFQANLFSKMAPSFQMAGVDAAGAIGGLAMSGMSDYDAMGLSKMLGGDLHEWSRRARAAGDWSWQVYGEGGMPIEKTSGTEWSKYVAANINKQTFAGNRAKELWLEMGPPQDLSGMGMYGKEAQAMVSGTDVLSSIFGPGEEVARAAFEKGGTPFMAKSYQGRMADLSAASAAISIASIHETQAFYWGESGTWDDPQRGSMWNLQDRMSGLQQKAAKADFRASRQRMEMGNRFSIQQENLSWDRMSTGHQYQRWTQQFQWDTMQQRQDWTRQDWKYQDTMQALGTEWQLEDYDEALRTAHGRDRRKVYTSRERFLTKTNLETEQKDTKRGQQEKLWKQEEERFEKQIKYSEKLMSLDTAQFNLTKTRRQESYEFELEQLQRKYDEYMEQLALEEQMRELEREHQANQLEFQLQQAGIQAAMAALQKEQAENLIPIENITGEIAKNIQDFMDADPTAALEALKLMAEAMSETDVAVYEEIGGIFDVIRRTLVDKFTALDGFVSSINKIDVRKLQSIIDLLGYLGNTRPD